jgi:hypothetical protein
MRHLSHTNRTPHQNNNTNRTPHQTNNTNRTRTKTGRKLQRQRRTSTRTLTHTHTHAHARTAGHTLLVCSETPTRTAHVNARTHPHAHTITTAHSRLCHQNTSRKRPLLQVSKAEGAIAWQPQGATVTRVAPRRLAAAWRGLANRQCDPVRLPVPQRQPLGMIPPRACRVLAAAAPHPPPPPAWAT